MASTTPSLKVYGMPFQHHYLAIKALCELTKTEHEFQITNLMEGDQNKPEFLEKFPMHQVPALGDKENGLQITEANAILRYIARKSGDTNYYPDGDLKKAAICDMVLDLRLCAFGKAIAETWLYPAAGFGPEPDKDTYDKTVEKIKKDYWPAVYKHILDGGHHFICGEFCSIADLSLWSFIKQVQLVEGDNWFLFKGQNCSGMRTWFEEVDDLVSKGCSLGDENYGFWLGKRKPGATEVFQGDCPP